MSSATTSKPFIPGTIGWTAADLDDPEIERQWFEGRFEIVEGVLTQMPPAYFRGHDAMFRLMYHVTRYLEGRGLDWRFAPQVDILIDEDRVPVADAVLLTPEERQRQDEAARHAGRADPKRARILIPPTLLIESVSPGHERHDRHTKRRWYAQFGVRNYWIIDAFAKSLECLVLEGQQYRVDCACEQDDEVRPSLFPDLVIPLKQIWGDQAW